MIKAFGISSDEVSTVVMLNGQSWNLFNRSVFERGEEGFVRTVDDLVSGQAVDCDGRRRPWPLRLSSGRTSHAPARRTSDC